MGRLEKYQCSNWLCRYSATVSGGSDMGMSSVSSTYACKKCGKLQDIGHSTDEDETLQELLSSNPGKTLEEIFSSIKEETPPMHCKKCGSQNLVKWSKGDACPKCGRKMKIVPGHHIMWD